MVYLDSQHPNGVYKRVYAHIVENLEKTVRKRYADILNNDMIYGLVVNLKVRFPATIKGIVPERISYGLLKEVMKGFII